MSLSALKISDLEQLNNEIFALLSTRFYCLKIDHLIKRIGITTMDDLNGDGKLTIADVDVLYKVFEKFQKQSRYNGGIGRYKPASHHGGFVHIDNRGFTARW